MRADQGLADAVGDADRSARGARDRAQHQAEDLIRRRHAVARQRNRHMLDGLSRGKRQRAAGRDIVAAGLGLAIAGGIGHAEAAAERLVQHHREGGAAGAGVDHDVAHRQAGRVGAVADGIVVDDRDRGVRRGDHRVDGARQHQGEAFQRFAHQVIAQGNTHRLGGGAGREDHGAAGVDIVVGGA